MLISVSVFLVYVLKWKVLPLKGDNTVSGIWYSMGDVDPEEIWVSGILRMRR